MEDHSQQALTSAKRLRRAMSLPEVLLWNVLRTRPQGVKFRRQHPLGNLVVDFFCAEHRLVVEIDGIAHDMGDQPSRDNRRDAWLRSLGFEIVRIPAAEVLKCPAGVAEGLVQFCRNVPPPTALRAATSPSGGGSIGMP